MKVKGRFLLLAVGILLDLPVRVVRVFRGSVRSRPGGIALAVAVPVVVVLWHLLALAARPPHLNQVVAELGSTMRFVANPIPNHACTRLVFLETTENGYGVFLSEGPGKRKLLFEQPSKAAGYVGLNESLLGWSPDDKLFAYCRRRSRWEIVICDGSTGAEAGTAPVNGLVSAAAWVGPEALVLADDKRVLQTVRRHHDQWVQPQPFKYYSSMNAVKGFLKALNVQPAKQPAELPIKGLSPFGPDSVVWQQGGTLYACGADSNAPVKLWESTPGSMLLEFAAAEPRKLLLHCRDASGEYLARLYPPNRITEVTRIKGHDVRPNHVMLINDGEGYAYFTQTGAEPDRLIIKPDDAHPATEVRWQDQVRYFAAGRDAVYVVSSLNDEPPGIWRCEAASGFTECVAPNVEQRFRYARNSHIAVTTITNASGEELTCYLLAPAHLTGGQKHPLVIGILGNQEMGFSWSANHEAIANCGAFFASVDRHQRGYSSWAEDAFTVYETLVQRPEIDRNKVLLYADSAGVSAVYDLLEQHPKLWRGAILFSPTQFPDPSRIPGARLFLDNGGADGAFGKEGAEVPRRFQDSAVRAGIPVTLIIHPGLPHTVRMPMGERERMREALIFLGGR
jgi:dipeptidyl aminopeptidase/acylaminoacyl peptidase